MRAPNKTGHLRNRYEPLRLVRDEAADEERDIFAGQTSAEAQRMRADIQRVARRPFNILITGETGTGKTQMARQLHRMSARAANPFVELNCANLPEQLVEAELFGHRKGAFTGADYERKGLFEEADGGILFLDEIGDIPVTVQNRLLKAIEEKQIKRLGTNHYKFCDVQIISATSRNLPNMIQAGEFREDLYCRVAVLTLEASPLRGRREDIPSMIDRFLREATEAVTASTGQTEVYRIDEDALVLLCEFEYPGNIRSLRNLIYELTSCSDDNAPISAELVTLVISRLNSRGVAHVTCAPKNRVALGPRGVVGALTNVADDSTKTENLEINGGLSAMSFNPIAVDQTLQACLPCRGIMTDHTEAPILDDQVLHHRPTLEAATWFLRSIAKEGDIILPLDLCVLRREETFKQWTARAKRCSIEAARKATGGTVRTAADRLGLTTSSLKGHLQRARRLKSETLLD